MFNASNAVDNQKVSICRLSDENRSVLIKALSVAVVAATRWMDADERNRNEEFFTQLSKLETQLKQSKELWLIES